MNMVLNIIDKTNQFIGKWIAFIIYPAFLLLTFEVISRYVFNSPTLWSFGVTQRIFSIYFIAGVGYIYLEDQNMRMDSIYGKLPLIKRKYIDVMITAPMVIFISFIMLWHGFKYAIRSFKILEVCPTPLAWPVWPIKFLIPIGGVLLLLQALATLYRDIVIILKERSVSNGSSDGNSNNVR